MSREFANVQMDFLVKVVGHFPVNAQHLVRAQQERMHTNVGMALQLSVQQLKNAMPHNPFPRKQLARGVGSQEKKTQNDK